MTTFGTITVECPSCKEAICSAVMLSGNTFGAVFYSDGYVDAPMLPRESILAKCPKCEVVNWRSSFKSDEELQYDMPEGIYLQDPSLTDKEDFLKSNIGDERELHLRHEMWHEYNHSRRHSDDLILYTDNEKQNMRALISLSYKLPEDGEEKYLILAELHRELGDADECERLLSHVTNKELLDAKKRISELNKESIYVATL